MELFGAKRFSLEASMTTDVLNPFFDYAEDYAVIAIGFRPNRIVLELALWTELWAPSEVVFEQAELQYLASRKRHGADLIRMPWRIIDFDVYKLSDGQWKFTLECEYLEVCWHSPWPLSHAWVPKD